MEDPRSMVGRLHYIVNSQHLEQGGIGIPPSVNPGTPTFVGLVDALAREKYMLYITCYLKAAAPLLTALERLVRQRSTRLFLIYVSVF
jgi:hypothetical protein